MLIPVIGQIQLLVIARLARFPLAQDEDGRIDKMAGSTRLETGMVVDVTKGGTWLRARVRFGKHLLGSART